MLRTHLFCLVLIFLQPGLTGTAPAGLIVGAAYFRRGLLLEGILRFNMGWA